MRLGTLFAGLFPVLLSAWGAQCAFATGLTWPSGRYLPAFSTLVTPVQCIDMDGLPQDEQALFSSLEGIVNRTQPRLACVSAASEGEFTWMNLHNLSHVTISGFSAIRQYETNVTGLVVYDTNMMHTLNLATTIAGVKNELICDAALLPTLTNAPYNLTIQDDLRGLFTTKYQVYGYLYTNYWSQCTHRLMAGLQTNNFWYLRDYLVATKCAVVWLDPTVSADASTLSPFLSGMTPVDGVYIGWWPNEGGDLQWIAPYGIPVMASDLFDNATVYGGVRTNIAVPVIPPVPPLQNKIYVSITLSDGDNVQYMQHTMYQNWQSSARGKTPIGWTVQPLLADFDPEMLNYFWSTASADDCLVAGPSGAGYTRINYWSAPNTASYTKASNHYLQCSGIRVATVWLTVSSATANTYATNCPTLVGVDDLQDGYYMTSYSGLPVAGFPSNGSYASTVSNLLAAVTNAASGWNGSSPMFISVEGDAWNIRPADCQTFASSLNSNFIVVRPDHLFLLYRQAAGLGPSGAAPFVTEQPVSQSAVPGTNIAFSVIASGTAPLSYQWQMNGVNIAGATASIYRISNVQMNNVGGYQAIITNPYGSVASRAGVITFGNQPVGFNGDGLDWTVNQSAGYLVYTAPDFGTNGVTLTDGSGNEAQSIFFDSPQYIGAFQSAFTYQAGGNRAADGISFCIQNDPRGPKARGGGGGGLGVSGISPSMALEFNLFTGNSQNTGYTLLTNGLTGASGANGNYHAPGNVNVASGDPIHVTLNYDNGLLALTFTDTVADTSFATNLAVGDLTQLLGTNTAWVGFTGADGGSTSIQAISNYSFISRPSPAIEAAAGNILVSWPGGTPGFTLQQNGNLTAPNWANFAGAVVLTNNLNEVIVPPASNMYYRLALPVN
ncbi:MAG: lectin-like domain-containing protein [Limisphaerales bacterium]